MAKGKTLCNLCGKEFDIWDEQEEFGIHTRPGYGSQYDGDDVDLDLCCRCFDRLMNKLIPMCKLDPLVKN